VNVPTPLSIVTDGEFWVFQVRVTASPELISVALALRAIHEADVEGGTMWTGAEQAGLLAAPGTVPT
jgi:hypothetical protein